MVNREHVIESMKHVLQARDERDNDRARQASADFAEFAKQRAAILMTAPDHDAKTPKGTIKLDTLSFPKRL